MKTIETERLILRHWREEDARKLFEYAKDPRVGPAAGWPPHTSPEDSLRVIREVLSGEETFAVTIRGSDEPVGSIGFQNRVLEGFEDEIEIGYWIAVPFWGQGYIPEAVKELLRYGFEENDFDRIWCGHYEGNEKSRRVIEKCGFRFAYKREMPVVLLGQRRTEYFYSISKEEWKRQ